MSNSSRLDLLDALRGCAIVAIMLLHNVEHFNLMVPVPGTPNWLAMADHFVLAAGYLLFGGKAYAVFALMFGVTFYLQFRSRALQGEDFRARFAWRLLLLFGFGMVNTLFYDGDILSLYAVLGFTLIPVAGLGNRALLAIAIVLSLQLWQWGVLAVALTEPPHALGAPAADAYFIRSAEYLANGTVLQVWWGNLTNGKMATIVWSWEAGRLLQIPALFMVGMVLARQERFHVSEANRQFWRRAFVWGLLALIPLAALKASLPAWIANEAVRRPLGSIVQSWAQLAALPVLLSCLILAYHAGFAGRLFAWLSPMGRMSLTSYMSQSLVGTFLYYGFGLALYRTAGPALSLLIGVVMIGAQIVFSIWWLRTHRQGPLEALWHRATWIGSEKHARRLAT
ncbi:DUF418 domain-containing protein [Massilia sp. CF038]|uniref:DUF418 domain-containing protein n=1 Tax=Massilia sp. CF038 TaxID=1881045 RepID=UPI000915237A|nr:DUF418 domain-containing protein [Massilia sp. CF038]SHG75657.1 uncharacterized protein SAMN05428948_1907 [Massilia sp. CF038]